MKLAGTIFTRKFGLTIMYGVLFLIVSAGIYLAISKLFAIHEIRVVGGNIQVSVDEQRLPRTLLFFPSDTLRAEILKNNPVLADIRFEKWYPHTLVIVPTLRPAAAVLITPSRRVFIDGQSIVLAEANNSAGGLPQIIASISGLRIGQRVSDNRVVSSLAFFTGMQSTLPLETATISDDGVVKAHSGNLDILFTQDEKTPKIITTLQTLLTGFRIKGTLPSVIDLRFDKPVITF